MSATFTDQLAATRANLERLEAMAAKQPELFEHASLIEVAPEYNRVYIHASQDRERDWLAWARQYRIANWKRRPSASDRAYWDYDGKIGELEISVLNAELREEPQPLFAGEAA